MDVKVSIIVPTYNVEEYLDRAVESMLKQTLKEIEIILVDDGSPDGCGAMCDAYAEKYPNISVVHKKNGGLSSARNAGMKVACGEYIGFVDPDDYIAPEMFEKLYNSAVLNNADFVGCGYQFKWSNGDTDDVHSNLPTGAYGRDVIVDRLAVRLFGDEADLYKRDTLGYAWMNIYRGETIRKNGLKFCSERKYYHEDEVFLLDFMFYAQTAAFVDEPLYMYCVREGSLIRCFRKNMWEMNSALIEKYRQFAVKYDVVEDYNRLVPALKLNFSLTSVLNECRADCPNSMRESIGVIKSICNEPIVREVLDSGEKRRAGRFDRLCLWLMRKRRPAVICVIYRSYYNTYEFLRSFKFLKVIKRKLKKMLKHKNTEQSA